MTPTFSDFFKSFYYSNTYMPSVNLNKQGISKHLLEKDAPEIASTVQRLISNPEVQQVLSEPLTYDMTEIPERNAILERHGFKLLSSKHNLLTGQRAPFYSVIEHDDLQGWIIKSGATRVPKGLFLIGPMNDRNEMAFFINEESLLRIEMAKRIAKVAQEAKIDVVLPKKKLVAYANVNGTTEPSRKYCVVCEKINILSVEATVQAIKTMDAEHQREIAKKISTIVQKAGIVDTSFENIRLTAEGKLAFIDTEPAGLMAVKKPGLWNRLFGPKGASVEKCSRIGLFTLMQQATKAVRGTQNHLGDQNIETGLKEFYLQVKSDYEKAATPKLSKWKITLSICSLGLIPLINVIGALAKAKLAKRTFKKLQAMNMEYAEKKQKYIQEKVLEATDTAYSASASLQKKIEKAIQAFQKEDFVKSYQKKYASIAKQFYAYIEGAPHKRAFA